MGVTLVVLYSTRLEACREFYAGLGLVFARERHGTGPVHYAAVLEDGCVLELYPATTVRETGALRLGLGVESGPLPPGRHVLRDPDGRTVEVLRR
ncbi:VOC family protein [Yinghuangia seranimata]|uniref:VOC family protein n=1 Tax=Yinghuangia seranimata TaxID=408067 RepID=UPI00248C8CD5|nr:VOC family protein [Yinghuangia seranimata]MDI2127473.1 VOC family protein [Yinghuangia seranimata]